jgi:glucose/mannose-6-phosphate isomerase
VLLAAAVLSGLDPAEHADRLEAAAERLRSWARPWEESHGPAAELARRVAHAIPVFYAGVGLYEPAAVRWRGQLAENAKMLSFHHLLPEMDHNEIVGWQENAELLRRCRALFLTGSHDHPRVARRIAITSELIGPHAAGVEVVRAPEGAPTEELLGLLLLGDWVSLHAAAEHGVDPVPVERIGRLKGALREPRAAREPRG